MIDKMTQKKAEAILKLWAEGATKTEESFRELSIKIGTLGDSVDIARREMKKAVESTNANPA